MHGCLYLPATHFVYIVMDSTHLFLCPKGQTVELLMIYGK